MRWLYFSQIKVVVLPGCLRMLGDSIAERFTKKKEIYSKSCIAITKDMGTSDILDWDLDSIIKRDVRISDLIVELFLRWENDYSMQNGGNLYQN